MQETYQEINLIDYIKTIIRRKRLIGTITLATVLITALVLFWGVNSAPLYETSGDILIGQVDGVILETKNQTNSFLHTEKTAKEILEQIEPETKYTKTDLQNLLKNIIINGFDIKTSEEPPDNIFSVAVKDERPARAMRMAEILIDKIIARHQKIFDKKQKISAAVLAQKQIELKRMKEGLKKVESKLDVLFDLRYPSSYAIAQGYASTGYIATRDNLINNVNALEEDILTRTHNQEQSEMSSIISPPLEPATTSPLQFPKMLALLIAAMILGAFLGTLYAFIAEWWKQNKNQIKA